MSNKLKKKKYMLSRFNMSNKLKKKKNMITQLSNSNFSLLNINFNPASFATINYKLFNNSKKIQKSYFLKNNKFIIIDQLSVSHFVIISDFFGRQNSFFLSSFTWSIKYKNNFCVGIYSEYYIYIYKVESLDMDYITMDNSALEKKKAWFHHSLRFLHFLDTIL